MRKTKAKLFIKIMIILDISTEYWTFLQYYCRILHAHSSALLYGLLLDVTNQKNMCVCVCGGGCGVCVCVCVWCVCVCVCVCVWLGWVTELMRLIAHAFELFSSGWTQESSPVMKRWRENFLITLHTCHVNSTVRSLQIVLFVMTRYTWLLTSKIVLTRKMTW